MQMPFITPSTALECPVLWRDFPTDNVCHATLEITGLGLYRAFLNGQRVGDDYLAPGFNDYDAYLRVQTYDVTDLLTAENRLSVWLGDGWYKGRFGTDGGRTDIWGDKYLLAARLTITHADGSTTVIETDESWQAAQSPILSCGIYDGEVRDDTREPGQSVPCVLADVQYELQTPVSPAIHVVDTLHPTLIVTPKGEQVLDFGQNAAGIIRFVNRLPKGATLRIQTGEVLQNGCFYRDNLRSAKSEFVYTSDGVVKEVEPTFTFFGFRYAKVEGLETVDPADFIALVLSSNLRPTLHCETSHAKLNQLMRNTFWGLRSNFLDVPTDCPQRDERLGWTADTQVFVNTACYLADCKAFYRKYMRDLRADQTRYYGGDIPAYSPSLKGEAIHGGAVWADAAAIIPWNVYMNYGDIDLLRENYPMMQDYAEYIIAEDAKNGGTHLIFPAFTFGDWLAQDGMTSQSLKGGTEDAFIQGVYFMQSIRLTAQAAQTLGETADAARYAALADEAHAALIGEYVTPGGRLGLDTQTAYVLALKHGICRDKEKLISCFRTRLKKDFYRITCGFTGAPLMLPVLLENGMTDVAYRMLLSEEFPGWLYAVNLGATTIWERWNSLEADGTISGTGMNSLNHYAYGSVCEAVFAHICGLQNAAPGWKKARIAPRLNGRIRTSDIRFDSPAGPWVVKWNISDDGKVELTVTVPEGASAEVALPDHPEQLTLTVEGGTHTWVYQPAVDYLHPFSAQSMMMELLECEEAVALLQEKAPGILGMAADPASEFRVESPIGVAFAMPFLNPDDAFALDPLLRGVHI